MNDDLCDFRHKRFDFSYSTGGIEVIGKVYTAREVDKRDFQVIIKLLEDNDWKLKVETLYDGHYIGNGIHSLGPFTTKSTVKTVKKIWKEKKKMNSVCGRIANLIMPKKELTGGGIGFTDLCSHIGVDFSTLPDGELHLIVNKDDFKKELNEGEKKMDKSQNWSPFLNRSSTLEEIMEEKFKCVINALIKNWKPGSLSFRVETSKGVEIGNEGKQSLLFGPFSKEEADFIEAKYVSKLTKKENVKEENKLKYIIDTLYVETKGLNLGIHSELVDEKLGKYEMYADVEDGDDFTTFTVSKEDMKFIIDKLSEIKKENVKEENVKEDLVNHPKHYTSDPSGVECIQITRHRNFNVGNAIKYLWRNGLKDGNSDIQDLEKAIWYLKDEIKRLKGEYDK